MKLGNNKGVTLITLSITIAILLIISGITINYTTRYIYLDKLNKMTSDIEMINVAISDYYMENNSLPTFSPKYLEDRSDLETLIKSKGGKIDCINSDDSGGYYVIDLSNLDNLTLNYGREYKNCSNTSVPKSYTDLYIINKVTHQIYYPQGIQYNGMVYFTKTN